MKDRILSLIARVKGNPALRTADEAAIKQAVVLPLLQILGWDSGDINEVFPEYTVESRRVDYALRVNGTNEFFLEAKRPGENLEAHEEQLLEYSFRQGVELAALTNGFTWFFYLPTRKGDWSARRFYAIDIDAQDPDDVAEKFIAILSKSNVTGGQALQHAEAIYKGRIQKQLVEETLPKAWNKIVSDPEPRLVDLIVEITEKLCGSRPTALQAENFLKSNTAHLPFTGHPPATRTSGQTPPLRQSPASSTTLNAETASGRPARVVDRRRRRTTRPREVRIGGCAESVRAWNEIPVVVANWILSQGKALPRVENFVHEADADFAQSALTKELNNGWFIEIGDSQGTLVQKGRRLLDDCGLRNVGFQIRLEDGTTKSF